LDEAAQTYASNEYANVYDRAYKAYLANLQNTQQQNTAGQAAATFGANTGQTEFANKSNNATTEYNSAYNTFLNNQNNPFNKLFQVAGLGSNAASGANALGEGYASLYSGTNQNNANALGNIYGQAANAGAAGTVGAANAINTGLGQVGNLVQQQYLYGQLFPTKTATGYNQAAV
jgi:hypothetical protein